MKSRVKGHGFDPPIGSFSNVSVCTWLRGRIGGVGGDQVCNVTLPP